MRWRGGWARGWRSCETHELDDPRYTANNADRCYFCKVELFDHLAPLAERLGLAHIAYGMNRDDHGDWRPGQRAAREHGVRAPLDEAGMGKAEIRALAHYLDVPVWEKPAEACYSSRIPYGTPVTVEALRQIGRAERALAGAGLPAGAGAPPRDHRASSNSTPTISPACSTRHYASRLSPPSATRATRSSRSICRATAPARSTRRSCGARVVGM